MSAWKTTSQDHADFLWSAIRITGIAIGGGLFLFACFAVPMILGALFPAPTGV